MGLLLRESGESADVRITRNYKNQSGEIPVGTILVIGLIAIPLVITLLIFRESIYMYLIDRWVDLVTSG